MITDDHDHQELTVEKSSIYTCVERTYFVDIRVLTIIINYY